MTLVTLRNGRSFAADAHASILDSALGHGIVLEYSCRSGRCGACKAGVVSGETRVLQDEESLSAEERAAGLVLTCCRAADGDVSIDIEDLSRLAGVAIKTLPCRIAALQRLAPDIIGVTLRVPPGSALAFLPGQYVDVIASGVRRSYSLANAPRADHMLELHIRNYPGGHLSRFWFDQAKVGDLLRFQAPLGTFFFRQAASGPVIFLATGTGIAPVKAVLEELDTAPGLAAGRPISVYWGNRHSHDHYWTPAFANLPVTFIPLVSRPDGDWAGRSGYVQDAALADLGRFDDAEVYACGAQDMIHAARALLTTHGLPAASFFSDAFVSSH